jgi:hypothetical protein
MMPAKSYGAHIGAIHNWIQWNAFNGDRVTWGSDERLNLKRALTVRELEEIAQRVADAVIDDIAMVTAEKIQAAWDAAGYPSLELRAEGKYRISLTTQGERHEYLLLEHALGALMRLRSKETTPEHFLIYTRSDEPIGCCGAGAQEEVLAEEPAARFVPVDPSDCPICKKDF